MWAIGMSSTRFTINQVHPKHNGPLHCLNPSLSLPDKTKTYPNSVPIPFFVHPFLLFDSQSIHPQIRWNRLNWSTTTLQSGKFDDSKPDLVANFNQNRGYWETTETLVSDKIEEDEGKRKGGRAKQSRPRNQAARFSSEPSNSSPWPGIG
jgi:hypothetical protein